MYDYLDEGSQYSVVGSFSTDKNADFKQSTKHLMESFTQAYQMDPVSDIASVLKIDALKESYKNLLLEDVRSFQTGDPYMDMMPAKLEQLVENSGLEILKESGVMQLAPIVGISLPILKKSYIEGHAKDIMMSEVASKPIIKAAFERRFLKDAEGNKYYIPDVFYDDRYKEVMSKGRGKAISSAYYPTDGQLPIQDLKIMELSGGTMRNRDSLALDFCVQSVIMTAGSETATIAMNVQPNWAADGAFTYRVKHTAADGQVYEDILIGQVDQYYGTVSCASTKGLITKVQFGGHLSNENNWETVEVDRERELMEWKIPDGVRLNTGLTLEKIKDYKALFDFDITTEIISDMSTVLAQYEDSEMLDYVHQNFDVWKTKTDLPFGYTDGFTAEGWFNCNPPANKFVTRSQWIDTELKYDLNRFIDELKVKLRHQDLMFVVYGHPNLITLIQDNVRWVIDEDTKVGGIQLDYKFGVMTANKNRIHVISTLKCPLSRGLRVVAYPTSKEMITFKHYNYSLNIENAYRNPYTPLTPNVMATSRFITTHILPVQGEFHILENEFGLKNPATAATSMVATPVISLAPGEYTGAQIVTVSCATPGVNIYYTVDGSTPSATNGTLMNGVISIASSATLKVVAVKPGMIDSAVAEAAYVIA